MQKGFNRWNAVVMTLVFILGTGFSNPSSPRTVLPRETLFCSQAVTPFLIWVRTGRIAPHAIGKLRHRWFSQTPIIAHHVPGSERLRALIAAASQAASQSGQENFVDAVEKNIQIVLGKREIPQALGHLQADGGILYDLPVLTAYVQLVCAAYKGKEVPAEEVNAIWRAVKEDTHVHELVEAILRRSPVEQTQQIRNRAMELWRDGDLQPLRYGLAANDAVGAAFHLIAQLLDDQGRKPIFGGWLLDLDERDRATAEDLFTHIRVDNPVWIAFEAVLSGTLTRVDEIQKFEQALRSEIVSLPASILSDPEETARAFNHLNAVYGKERDVFDHLAKQGLTMREVNELLDIAYLAFDNYSWDQCMFFLKIPQSQHNRLWMLLNYHLPSYMKSLWPEVRTLRALFIRPIRPPLKRGRRLAPENRHGARQGA